MTTPADERDEPNYSPHRLPSYNVNTSDNIHNSNNRSSDDEGTVVNENGRQAHVDEYSEKHDEQEFHPQPPLRRGTHLSVQTALDYQGRHAEHRFVSPSQSREQSHRLEDDLELLKIERQISRIAEEEASDLHSTLGRSRSRRDDTIDEFDIATNPIHEKTAVYKPPENPVGAFSKFWKRLHQSSFIVRYITYITPVVLILLIPLLIGALVSPATRATVGGVELLWFMIWLEIVWLTLWAGRLLAKCLPWPIGLFSSLFTNNSKKWRDMGKQLELPATLFFWWLGIEVSFLPIMRNHRASGTENGDWTNTVNKILVSVFVGVILNFIEKIIIQLIAISFHLRTYADRIEINKFQIGSLTKLYTFSKAKIAMEDSEFEAPGTIASGARTPAVYLNQAQKQTKQVLNKVGDVAGRIAGDFTGRQVNKSTHPSQVVLALLGSTSGSQILARRLYRTFANEETESVHPDDLKNAFDNDDEADAAFSMFDKDMNGDISMEELEAVCVEIGRERKSITASLKDLDSVVGKLDDVFMFIVLIVTVVVFISLISTSASGVLTSAGSSILALSWLFSVTAQEFLQSCIFVFVKHPFDVGDRVTIYGNTGASLTGDDYFVKEIALLYTEFKKMEGHLVQAPNSYLNTLFILNQRRSGGLAEALPIVIKFGTTLEQIEGLRNKLLEFVRAEKREYQGNILTELRSVTEVHSLTLNVIFFYKSNWQNEGLRLARRNKFICALMVSMQELGIEGPRMRYPGQKESFPVYMQQMPHIATPGTGRGGHPDNPNGWRHEDQHNNDDPSFVAPPSTDSYPDRSASISGNPLPNRHVSILRNGSTARPRKESLSAMNRRVDFSLGMSSLASSDMAGDVFEERRTKLPASVRSPSPTDYRNRRSESQSRVRQSLDVGRSTSLMRRDTEESRTSMGSGGGVVHRNRFFGRHRVGTADAAANDELCRMESGMADIPEDPSLATNTPVLGAATATITTSAAQHPAVHHSAAPLGGLQQHNTRIDPRTGLVSPAAWRMRTDESNVVRASQESQRTGRHSQEIQRPITALAETARPADGVGHADSVSEVGHGVTGTESTDFELQRLDK